MQTTQYDGYEHPAQHPFCEGTDIDTWTAIALTAVFVLALLVFG